MTGVQTCALPIFCITDALLAAAIRGDVENGLFYTGQSVTRIPDRSAASLPSVQEILEAIDARLALEARRAPGGSAVG